jgi:DNA-binding NtrC family response regulator
MNVLIVDDDKAYLKLLERHISPYCNNIHSAHHPLNAIDIITKNNINLVITDYDFKTEINGFDLLIRILEINPAIPVIIQTCILNDNIEVSTMKNGAFACYAKPSHELIIKDIIMLKKKGGDEKRTK